MSSVPLFRVRQSAHLAVAAAMLLMSATDGDASIRHRHHHIARPAVQDDAGTTESSGRYADFVVDGKTGRVLHATNADQPRHPASLTKMMTLFILFEELERGHLTMASELKVSAHAAAQSPTKLDLRPGQEISVSDAIHGLVTQSANDAAVTIAENIAGSESDFARRMTATAHRIGMSNTYFYNASGLPNSEQYTTARDMVTLGRALQERFPENYKVFSTRSFAYRGRVYGNHNHLLGRLDGVDGIKTGYTEASGFNLVTSIHRDGHFIVAAVMGGSSGAARDAQMVRLVEAHLPETSTGPHVASVLTDTHATSSDADEKPSSAVASATPHAAVRLEASAPAATTPETVSPEKTALPHIAARPERANQEAVTKVDDHVAARIMAKAIKDDRRHRQVVASLDDFMPSAPPARPSAGAPVSKTEGMATDVVKPTIQLLQTHPVQEKAAADHSRPDDLTRTTEHLKPGTDPGERLMTASIDQPVSPDKPRVAAASDVHAAIMPGAPRPGWLVQIAATDRMTDAEQLLTKAKNAVGDRIGSATPVAEPVAKGAATFYRARFTGFADQKSASAACNSLKHKDFACLVIHQ